MSEFRKCGSCKKNFKINDKYPDNTKCFSCLYDKCENYETCKKWVKIDTYNKCYDCHQDKKK